MPPMALADWLLVAIGVAGIAIAVIAALYASRHRDT